MTANRHEEPTLAHRAGTHRGISGPNRDFLPIWSCSVWGLPCLRRYRRSGALLPHLFTLTCVLADPGGIFSVALAVPRPLRPGPGRYPAHCPAESGLSSTGVTRQRPSGCLQCHILPAAIFKRHNARRSWESASSDTARSDTYRDPSRSFWIRGSPAGSRAAAASRNTPADSPGRKHSEVRHT
jgi:hypothetical protein